MNGMLFRDTDKFTLLKNISNSKELVKKVKSIDKQELIDNLDDYIIAFKKIIGTRTKDVDIEIFKQLGKMPSDSIRSFLMDIYSKLTDTLVKRECLSAIGRLRDSNCIPFLEDVLENELDPKLLLQAIRSLLVFKKEEKIISILRKMENHPNEMINEVIDIELNPKIRSTDIHSEVDPNLKNIVVNEDVLKALHMIKDEKIHLTFTSPPYYNARDYSIYRSYQEYLDFLREVFKEVHRVTKNGRFLIVNSSPIIIPRVSRKHSSKRYPIPFDINYILTQEGWEFIDDIIWEKPEYSVKNRIGGFMQHRKPLSYKPNTVTEYIMVYRKKTQDLIDWNLRQYDNKTIKESLVGDDFDTTNIWRIDPATDKVHSAVFPRKLCEKVIKYYSFVGDLVFDPFGGSGTLADVALDLKRNVFTTEVDLNYFNHIKYNLRRHREFIKYINKGEFKKWISQDQ